MMTTTTVLPLHNNVVLVLIVILILMCPCPHAPNNMTTSLSDLVVITSILVCSRPHPHPHPHPRPCVLNNTTTATTTLLLPCDSVVVIITLILVHHAQQHSHGSLLIPHGYTCFGYGYRSPRAAPIRKPIPTILGMGLIQVWVWVPLQISRGTPVPFPTCF